MKLAPICRDEDGDGTIDAREFRQALPFLGINVDMDVANTFFQSFDKDNSGQIDLKEVSPCYGGDVRGQTCGKGC